MRISDWSSDVFSSDLQHHVVAHQERQGRKQRFPDGLLHEVGEEDDERAPPESGHGLSEGAAVVALGKHGSECVHPLSHATDRKSDVYGKRVSVRVNPGGRKIIKKKKQ